MGLIFWLNIAQNGTGLKNGLFYYYFFLIFICEENSWIFINVNFERNSINPFFFSFLAQGFQAYALVLYDYSYTLGVSASFLH